VREIVFRLAVAGVQKAKCTPQQVFMVFDAAGDSH